MKSIAFAALCLSCGFAVADSRDVVQVHSLQVKERMQTLELINVTAEKPPADDAEQLDRELEAILAEAAALEADEPVAEE